MLKSSIAKSLVSHHSSTLNRANPFAFTSAAINYGRTCRSSSSSYFKSRVEESPDKYTDFEKSFKEWQFVEKLKPPTSVPTPPQDTHVDLPSGWRPQTPPKDCSYHVRRTKNHQIPAYLKIMDRGQVRYTYIKKVEGNIWQLEKDIGEYLQKEIRPKHVVITRTHEICRHVIIKGDLVEPVVDWLKAKGF